MIPLWLLIKIENWLKAAFAFARTYWKQIAAGLIVLILAAVISKWFLALLLALFAAKPKFDEKQVQTDIQRQKQINDAELEKKIERGTNTIKESDARIRQAEKQTRDATANKSRGVSGKELDEIARDEK